MKTKKPALARTLAREVIDKAGGYEAVIARLRASKDRDGLCTDSLDVRPGVTVVLIENRNFQGGFSNGGGRGLYLRRQGVGMVRTERLHPA